MSEDSDETPKKEERDWLAMALRLVPLLNLVLKVLEFALKLFRRL